MNQNKNKECGAKPGFTLVELMMVIGIIVVLMAAGLGGLVNSQEALAFTNAYERVIQTVREARSLAVTGKAQLDYTDYDKDGLVAGDGDLVTPANYGVDFNKLTGMVTLFADLHRGDADMSQNEGVYNAPTALNTYEAGKDLNIAEFPVDSDLLLVIAGGPQRIFYSPIFADVTFDAALAPGPFFIFGVSEGTGGRHRCSKIHPIAGVPEVATNTECPET